MGKMRTGGQAVILDSLVFLSIALLVSSSLLAAMERMPSIDDCQEYTEHAHSALLRCTVDVGGRSMSMFECLLLVLEVEESDSWSELEAFVQRTLDSIMLPRFDYRWTATLANGSVSIGARSAPTNNNIYASISSFELLGNQVTLSLEAWLKS